MAGLYRKRSKNRRQLVVTSPVITRTGVGLKSCQLTIYIIGRSGIAFWNNSLITSLKQQWLNDGIHMSKTLKRGWAWAYYKMRELYCSRLTAGYRATRYALLGDTGTFYNDLTGRKIRIYR